MAFHKEQVMAAARKLADKGQTEKAILEYLRVVEADPEDARVWLKLGDLHLSSGSKEAAIEAYLKVARVYQEQGFFLKAVAIYKQILGVDPRSTDAARALPALYRELGLTTEANEAERNLRGLQ